MQKLPHTHHSALCSSFMNKQALIPGDFDYADVLMQREHLARQQRIRRAKKKANQRTTASTSRRTAPVGIHDLEVGEFGKAQLIPSTGKTTTSRAKTQGTRYETKGHHSEYDTAEAVGQASSQRYPSAPSRSASSRGNTRGQIRLWRGRRVEDRESHVRQVEKKNRKVLAQQHSLKAALLKVWRALVSVTEFARLQTVKAERHHQYCVMHRTWIKLIRNATDSRARKTEQVGKQTERSSTLQFGLSCRQAGSSALVFCWRATSCFVFTKCCCSTKP